MYNAAQLSRMRSTNPKWKQDNNNTLMQVQCVGEEERIANRALIFV